VTPRPDDDELVDAVREHKERLKRAREEPVGSPWRTAARVGALGWLMALPPALGAFVGHMIDRRFGGGIAWALGLMFLGLVGAGTVLWRALLDAQEDSP